MDKLFETHLMDEVEIDVENDWNLRFPADGSHCFQDFGRRCAGFKSALRSQLVHQPVCKRIAKRNTEFHDVNPGSIEANGKLTRRFKVWITSSDINDETFPAVAF